MGFVEFVTGKVNRMLGPIKENLTSRNHIPDTWPSKGRALHPCLDSMIHGAAPTLSLPVLERQSLP